MSLFSEPINAALLAPLDPSRVSTRQSSGKKLSYLEAWDVKRTLTRIFGFGGWSADVTSVSTVFAQETVMGNGKAGHKVGHIVTLCLAIHPDGITSCTFTEAAVGFATLPDIGEAYDMSVKTAESDALKRAAINLGDQFGLSLYNNGSTAPVVGHIVGTDTAPAPSVQARQPMPAPQPDSDGSAEWVEKMRVLVADKDVAGLVALRAEMSKAGVLDDVNNGITLAKWLDSGVVRARGGDDK